MSAELFRKKPVTIEAIRWTTENLAELLDWGCPATILPASDMPSLIIGTLEDGPNHEAVHVASAGDWIIKGIAGEYYPVKPEIFDGSYERVDKEQGDKSDELTRLRAEVELLNKFIAEDEHRAARIAMRRQRHKEALKLRAENERLRKQIAEQPDTKREYRVRYKTLGSTVGMIHDNHCPAPNGYCNCTYLERSMVWAIEDVRDEQEAKFILGKRLARGERAYIEHRVVSEWDALDRAMEKAE